MRKAANKSLHSFHAHPITILFNLTRVLYFIIVPVIRGFILALQGDFASWAAGGWIDILIFLLMVLIAVIRWYSLSYYFDGEFLMVSSGMFFKQEFYIARDKILFLSLDDIFLLRPLHVVYLQADTLGTIYNKANFTMYISAKQAKIISKSYLISATNKNKNGYTPGDGAILLFAFFTSSSFAGIVFMATFVSQTGKLFGQNYADMIIDRVEVFTREVAFGIPPAAAILAYILLLGWLIGLFNVFIRYKNMTMTSSSDFLHIKTGAFTRRDYYINYNEINYIDIRQNIFTKLLGISSLYINAVGVGNKKRSVTCVIPSAKNEQLSTLRIDLFPKFAPSSITHKPHPFGLFRFIFPSLSILAAIITAMVIMYSRFVLWQDFTLFVGLMLMVPALFYLALQVVNFLTSGLAVAKDNYTLYYSSAFNLHKVIIPVEKIVHIEMRQSIFQRVSGYCDLFISTIAERPTTHRCKTLSLAKLKATFGVK